MRSPKVLGFLSMAVGLAAPATTSAQYSKDNSSPPIDVPTAPVPQGTNPPPAAAKPPPAKPAPVPAPATASKTSPPPADPKEGQSEGSGPKYNNEGVFKVSGTKGPGIVSVGAKTGKKPDGKPAAKAVGATTTKAAKGLAKKTTAANVAQWPGFRLTNDGGSEVMVEFSSSPAGPTEHRAAGSVTYVFKGAHVIKSNNKNPLITVHFNTPVLSARLVPKKGELHLVVDMRPGANPALNFGLRSSSDGDGQQFFVKFPSGAWLPKGAENQEEWAPPPTQKLKVKGKAPGTLDKSMDTTPNAAPTTPPKTESGGKTGPAP